MNLPDTARGSGGVENPAHRPEADVVAFDDHPILVSRAASGIAIMTLNRPDRLNALNAAVAVRMMSELRSFEQDPEVRVVILTGAGRAFCSGADLRDRSADVGELLRGSYNPLVTMLRTMEIPIIAAINGVAFGAGAALTLACDLRVFARSANLQLSFAKVGLGPDCGSSWLLPEIVGSGRALDAMIRCRTISADEALSWGLATEVVDDGEALNRAIALAAEIAAVSRSIGQAKRLVHAGRDRDLTTHLEDETATQARLIAGPDFAEAVEAFAQKRAPDFGRSEVGVTAPSTGQTAGAQ